MSQLEESGKARDDSPPPPRQPATSRSQSSGWIAEATGARVPRIEAASSRAVPPTDPEDDLAITPAPPRGTTSAAFSPPLLSDEDAEGGMELMPPSVDMIEAIVAEFENNRPLARQAQSIINDAGLPAFLADHGAADDARRRLEGLAPEDRIEEIRARLRTILTTAGPRPKEQNAVLRWTLNLLKAAYTVGLISAAGFAIRPFVQSKTVQSLGIGQHDEKTGLAEAVFIGGQVVSTILTIPSAAAHLRDKDWDAMVADFVYGIAMLLAIPFALLYKKAAVLAPTTTGAVFYSGFSEILKKFKDLNTPQMGGVQATGARKYLTNAMAAINFTVFFIPATAWSYTDSFVGGTGQAFGKLSTGKQIGQAAQIGLAWGSALLGYAWATPGTSKLLADKESGTIPPLEYDARLKWAPKDVVKDAIQIANDANKFFAFVLTFNAYLVLNGAERLGPSGEDAIPDEASRVVANTAVSSAFCLLLCMIYEIQYNRKKKPPTESTLRLNGPEHARVNTALAALRAEVSDARTRLPGSDALGDIIRRHMATLNSEPEKALFLVLLYADSLPAALEARDRRIEEVASREGSERAASEQGGSPPRRSPVRSAEPETEARPAEERVVEPERTATPPEHEAPPPEREASPPEREQPPPAGNR